ncbi:MAG TPA: hypothetical protein DEB20_00850 [Acidimicrobiaceae bacterium]|nr:hypothetical protein [Acidimicrobiaceae bacterium]
MNQGTRALRLAAGGVLVVGSSGTAALIAATPAGASTFSVSNTNDSGAGSLRQAVLDANANAGADTITFDPSVTGTITLTSGQIAITDTVTITGPGATALEVSGNDASRIFDIATSGTAVTISGLSFVDGLSPAWNGVWSDWGATGGAIRVTNNAAITLDQISMSDNETTRLGGGIGTRNAASVTITNSSFTSNFAQFGGGGMSFYGGGAVSVDRVTVSGNTAAGGQTVSGEYGYGGGGARFAGPSSVSVTDSTFSSNTLANTGLQMGPGGGIYMGAWGGGPQIVEGVTIESNTSNRHGSGFASFGPVVIANSTITGNVNTSPSGTYGGAVNLSGFWSGAVRAKVLQTTITGNTSNGVNPSGLQMMNRTGRSTDLSVGLYGSVVAGNIGGPDVGFPDNWGSSQNNQFFPATKDFMIDSSNSVIGSVRATTPFTDFSGNQLNVTDPMLAPLANNGGPTKTMAVLPGSPLLDAAGSTVPTFPRNQYDQRGVGFARLSGSALDVGAYEVQQPTLTAVAPPTGSTAGGSTIALTGSNFVAGMTVTVGGAACTDVVVVSSTEATCTVPPGSAGAVDVAIDVLGLAASLPEAFTYVADPNGEVVPTFTG